MSRLRIVLISLAGAAVVFGGGWFLGALVGDAEPVAIADDDAGVQIPLAVPLGYGEDLPDAEGFDDLLEPASVRLPVDLVEPVPLADDDTPPPLGAFRIAGTDVEPVELVDDGPRPPFEPLTTPLGEPDADGDIDPAGWETTGDAEEVELEELLGPPPEEFEGDSSDPAGGDDAGASVLFHYGFFDWCAEADADDGAENGDSAERGGFCPFGIGGTILPIDDGGSLPPFEIGAVYWDDVFFTDACHPLGWRDGDTSTYHLLLRANAPGEFRVNYRHQAVPSFGIPAQIVASTTQEQEDEWIARSAAGERFNDVEICLPVAIPEQWPPGYLTLEIRGTDINGRIAERRLGAALAIRDDQRTVRPPMQLDTTYSNRRMSDAFLSVPFDPEREQAWLAVIPRDGPRAMTESCTDIERAVLDRSHPLDPVVSELYTARMHQRGENWDPEVTHAVVAHITPEPGTTYDFCGWATRPGPRSFDPLRAMSREQITARSPEMLSARISITGGIILWPLEPWSLTAHAVNWNHSGQPTHRTSNVPGLGERPLGEFTLDEPLLILDGTTQNVPNETVLQLSTTEGWTRSVLLPTPVRCVDLCPEPSAREYGVPLPGPGVAGFLRVLVETEAGPSGAPTSVGYAFWSVPEHSEFGPPEPLELPATPRIDLNASSLRAFGSGLDRPRLQAEISFDRPVRVIEAIPARYYSESCGREPEPISSEEVVPFVRMTWDELCHKAVYTLSLLVEDEDGNQLDLRTVHHGGPHGQDRGFGIANTHVIEVDGYHWEVRVNRLADYVGVHYSWFSSDPIRTSGGGVAVWCMRPDEPRVFSGSVRRPYGRFLEWSEEVEFMVEVIGSADGENCGVDDPTPHVVIRGVAETAALLDEAPVVLELVNDDIDVTVTITDVVPRP